MKSHTIYLTIFLFISSLVWLRLFPDSYTYSVINQLAQIRNTFLWQIVKKLYVGILFWSCWFRLNTSIGSNFNANNKLAHHRIPLKIQYKLFCSMFSCSLQQNRGPAPAEYLTTGLSLWLPAMSNRNLSDTLRTTAQISSKNWAKNKEEQKSQEEEFLQILWELKH